MSTVLELARERGETVDPAWKTAPVVVLPNTPPNTPDVKLTTVTNRTLSENSMSVSPLNNNIAFCGSNSTDWPVTVVLGTGVSWTTDGGLTWTNQLNGPGGVGNRGDPAAVIDLNGKFYIGYISNSGGMGVSYSTNMGASWSHVSVTSTGGQDKNHLMVDNTPSSPFAGRVYNSWVDLGGGANANDNVFSFSSNGGANWSPITNISNNVFAGSHNQGVNIQVGPNGEVYAVWAIYDGFPADETALGFNRSTNGGASWVGEFRAVTNIRGVRNTSLPNTSIRRNSFPSMAVDVSNGPRRGTIYVVWTNVGVPGVNTGDAEIYMVRSTNQGVNWSTPVRVNNDATTRSQWFPWISCDPVTGELSVIFYDRRDDPANSLTTEYVAHSVDGGATWENFRIGDVQFTPSPIPGLAGGYMGDYLGIAARGSKVYPLWGDSRTLPFTAYTSPFTYVDPGSPPDILVSTTAITDTLLETQSDSRTFSIRNQGGTVTPLIFSIAENPDAPWAVESPTADTLESSQEAIITIDYTTDELTPGSYTTNLEITSNDPDDPLEIVTFTLVVLPRPALYVDRENFDFTFLAGDSVTGDYNLLNVAGGTLTYNVDLTRISGPAGGREQFANLVAASFGSGLCRGNVYSVTNGVQLSSSEFYLDLDQATPLEFFVYSSPTLTGVFTKIYSSGSQIMGPGTQFFVSPPINIMLVPGTYYYIGTAWNADATFWHDNGTIGVPEPTSFGALQYGVFSGSGFPAPATQNLFASSIVYAQAVTAGFGLTVAMLTPTSGSLPGFTSTPQQFKAVAHPTAPLGTYHYDLRTTSNDPVTPDDVIDVQINVVGSLTAVDGGLEGPPMRFALHQNEPNPFNPMTRVAYDLPARSRVLITVFDAQGRRVKTLVDGTVGPGRHELPWLGTDEGGNSVASGIYFLRMEAGDFSERVKMVLVR